MSEPDPSDSNTPGDSSAHSSFERVLAEFLQAVEQNCPAPLDQLCDRYPQHADELREFATDHLQAEQLLGPVNPESNTPGETELFTPQTKPNSRSGLLDNGFELTPDSSRFGDYELLEEIDRGGMGVVFKARHRTLRRIVALKMIKSGELATAEEISRFHAEAEAAAGLTHPYLVPVYEAGECDGLHFIAMAFIEGETLAERLGRGPLEPRQAALLVRKLAEGIHHAHQHGVIHRDLKPSNVLIDASGEPCITDFGLAKNLNVDSQLTTTGQIVGTPAFMAPEQARHSENAITVSADIYALGAILYMALTGSAPHVAKTPIEIILKVLETEPVHPRSLNRRIPTDLARICLKCLEKKPSDRFAAAQNLAEELDRFLRDDPLVESHVSLSTKLRRWSLREPALVAHWVAIFLIFLVSTIFFALEPDDVGYYVKHTVIQAVWVAACLPLQLMLRRPQLEKLTAMLWGILDVCIFTTILWHAAPPRSTLLLGYPVLIVASGLFGYSRFVVMMTLLCIAGFWFLAFSFPADIAPRPAQLVFFPTGLIVLGLISRAQVRRLSSLSVYFDAR